QPQPQPQNYPPINLINPFLKPPTDSSNVSSEYARQAQDTMRFVYNSWDKLADKDRENSQEILKEMYPDFDISKKNYERLLRSQNPDSIRAEKERDELLEILNDAYSGFDNLSLAEQKDKVKFLEMMYPDYDTSREKYETYISSKKTENANKNKNSLNEILAIYANLHKAKNNGYMQNNNYMQNNGFGTAKIPTQYG
ncbi:MAG: hypothetical protein RR145_02180, partial [Oscillospiraceae bacterium]